MRELVAGLAVLYLAVLMVLTFLHTVDGPGSWDGYPRKRDRIASRVIAASAVIGGVGILAYVIGIVVLEGIARAGGS
jgi:hypothetical protein